MFLTQVFARMPLRSSLRAWSFLSSFQTFRGSGSFAAPNCSRAFAFVGGITADRNDSMLINWDANKETWSKYHYEWLRDNCNCPECYHPDTGQRILRTTEDARPDSVQSDDDRVEIKWKDGHSSQFVLSWLLENSYCHHNIDKVRPASKKPAQTLWDAEYFSNRELPSVDYEEYMKSDEVLLKMLQKFRQYGLCFIHNTPVSEEATGDALRRIGPLRKTYYGEVWTVVAGSMSIKCVCACVCVCARVHAYMCVHVSTCMHVCVHVCMYAFVCVCVHIHACTCIHVCACEHMHAYTHVGVCVHVYACVGTRVYMYICLCL